MPYTIRLMSADMLSTHLSVISKNADENTVPKVTKKIALYSNETGKPNVLIYYRPQIV